MSRCWQRLKTYIMAAPMRLGIEKNRPAIGTLSTRLAAKPKATLVSFIHKTMSGQTLDVARRVSPYAGKGTDRQRCKMEVKDVDIPL